MQYLHIKSAILHADTDADADAAAAGAGQKSLAYIVSYMSVCLPLPSPTAAACLAAAKDAFRACFWLDSDSTWMKMFARIRGINKCTPCASQFMYVCVVVCVFGLMCVRVRLGKLSSLSLPWMPFKSARMRVNRNLNYELEKIKKTFYNWCRAF